MDFLFVVSHHKKKIFTILLSLSSLLLISHFIVYDRRSKNSISVLGVEGINSVGGSDDCTDGVRNFADYRSKCGYVKYHRACSSKGYLNYLEIFYCSCAHQPVVGFSVLLLWLVVLFYVLGNTTSDYFCPSVGSLSRILKLSPTIAGTTLLPLGNGANDVFSSIISFTRSSDADVGLNSILGGAFFISCFVVGIVSISVSSRGVTVDKASFIRDVLFFLFVLCCLLLIIVVGQINFWFASGFTSLYLLYIALVSVMHFHHKEEKVINPPLRYEFAALETPLLSYVDEENGNRNSSSVLEKDHLKAHRHSWNYWTYMFLYVLELPISLPRKLTIPAVSEENWSKPFAATSATLAPVLMAALVNTGGENGDSKTGTAIYITSVLVGITLGSLTLMFTKKSSPPNRFLFPWVAGGFLMSITWTYIIVEELVSLLVALGTILGINPSILGVTVLAWGNSLGDLVSNLAMALKGGPDGAQVAISGCYAGPVFNTLVGLGLSLVFAAWNDYPTGYSVPNDSDLYETVGFLMAGLLWSLVILPKRQMELDKSLGVGLLAIYFCFLFVRLVKGLGLLKLGH